MAFEFNNHSFCTGTGLIRSGSVQFVYIGFQVFSAYFRVFQFVNDVFFQALHIFIFFFFINVEKVKKKKYQNLGIPEIVYYNLEEQYSFLDYIFEGIEKCFHVAVDFTVSYGNPLDSRSLQDRNGNQPNIWKHYKVLAKYVKIMILIS